MWCSVHVEITQVALLTRPPNSVIIQLGLGSMSNTYLQKAALLLQFHVDTGNMLSSLFPPVGNIISVQACNYLITTPNYVMLIILDLIILFYFLNSLKFFDIMIWASILPKHTIVGLSPSVWSFKEGPKFSQDVRNISFEYYYKIHSIAPTRLRFYNFLSFKKSQITMNCQLSTVPQFRDWPLSSLPHGWELRN